MPKIFISYRREDAAPYAGRLYDHLSARFGADQIFMDIDTIQPGDDFVVSIEEAVGACDILIALIGDQWLTSVDKDSARRIDNPSDFVHLEVVTALKRNIRTIPVLVEGAKIPRLEELPEELKTLSRRNAVEMRDTTWRQDVASLIKVIEKLSPSPVSADTAPRESSSSKFPMAKLLALVFGALIIAVILFLLWFAFGRTTRTRSENKDTAQASPAATAKSPAGMEPTATNAPRPTPTVPVAQPEPSIYSKGTLTVRGTWSCDLDNGAESEAGGDFWWEQRTGTERYLAPKNGATFSVLGHREFNSISGSELKKFAFSPEPINGSDAAYNRISTGTVVAFVTNEGRFGKFRVDNYGYNLTISWMTYSK